MVLSKLRKGKRGQLEIQETILVVFMFVIIIIIGLVVFYRFQLQSIKEEAIEAKRVQFNSMIITLPDIPEIACSEAGVKGECVDVYKLIALKKVVENDKARFFTRFGWKNITFYLFYPEQNKEECGRGRIKDCGVWNIYLKKPKDAKTVPFKQESAVSLYFSDEDKYAIGLLVVEGYKLE